MNIKQIQRGKWYETKLGIGRCEAVGGTRPPSCRFIITQPIPRGIMNVPPRDVIREVDEPESPAAPTSA